jgi:hypothetical protein
VPPLVTLAHTSRARFVASGALLWYHDLAANGLLSGVVIAMDWGAFKYLRNRNVPAVLMQSRMHLDVCCLRRFRMVPWRSTNDVKASHGHTHAHNHASTAVPCPAVAWRCECERIVSHIASAMVCLERACEWRMRT